MTPPLPAPSYRTVAEVSADLRLSRQTVLRLLASGTFPGAWRTRASNKGHWRIPRVDIESYLQTHRTGGTP